MVDPVLKFRTNRYQRVTNATLIEDDREGDAGC